LAGKYSGDVEHPSEKSPEKCRIKKSNRNNEYIKSAGENKINSIESIPLE
jgi:hypothetical protein